MRPRSGRPESQSRNFSAKNFPLLPITRSPFFDMPKAEKERLKHAASLSTQILADKSPYATESKRSKRKRKSEENDETEQVVSGKLSQQILTLAREQLDEEEDEEVSGNEYGMTWRDSQRLGHNWSAKTDVIGMKGWKRIPRMRSGRMKKSMRSMMSRTWRYVNEKKCANARECLKKNEHCLNG
jgi:hypothetical protein